MPNDLRPPAQTSSTSCPTTQATFLRSVLQANASTPTVELDHLLHRYFQHTQSRAPHAAVQHSLKADEPASEELAPAPPKLPRYRVRVTHRLGLWPTRELTLRRSRVAFGRAEGNDIVLPCPRRTVSRHHFEIHFHDRSHWLVDTHSRNATRMAGARCLDPGERYVLLDGDVFEVGDYRITFLGTGNAA